MLVWLLSVILAQGVRLGKSRGISGILYVVPKLQDFFCLFVTFFLFFFFNSYTWMQREMYIMLFGKKP